jgi:hypothetical protein
MPPVTATRHELFGDTAQLPGNGHMGMVGTEEASGINSIQAHFMRNEVITGMTPKPSIPVPAEGSR